MLPLISSVIVVGFCHNTPASHTRNIWSIGPLIVLGHWQLWIFASFSSTGSLEWMGPGPDWLQSTSARLYRGSNRIVGQWYTVWGEELMELNMSGWTTAGTNRPHGSSWLLNLLQLDTIRWLPGFTWLLLLALSTVDPCLVSVSSLMVSWASSGHLRIVRVGFLLDIWITSWQLWETSNLGSWHTSGVCLKMVFTSAWCILNVMTKWSRRPIVETSLFTIVQNLNWKVYNNRNEE